MEKIRVGLVGLMHPKFKGNKEFIYKQTCKSLGLLAKKLDFDLYIVSNGIITEKEALSASRELEEAKIDFLLVQNLQFASGRIIKILSQLPVYIGLWAIPETESKGYLPLNSFCGMNMNASILGEYFGKKEFKWFYGNAEEEWFHQRLKITIKALQAIKNTLNTKMGLIGGIADGFADLYYDERKLFKRFKIKVEGVLDIYDIIKRAHSYQREEVSSILKEIVKGASGIHQLASKALEDTARICKAFMDICHELDLSGLALSCWPKIRLEMNLVPCAAVAYLNQIGIPTACEGDVYGLISMFLLRQLTSTPTLVMDLVDFDLDDQSILLWHCGIGCKSLAYNEEVYLRPHCNPETLPGGKIRTLAPVAEMIYRPGKATVTRITREGKNLFILDGKFSSPKKPSFDGSRGWLSSLQMNRVPIDVRDLVNTIMVKRLQHHYVVGLDDHTQEMLEIASWFGMTPVHKICYEDYLQIV